ncbi:MAG: Smr/MutS family protein [Saprospiraceae bacterium]
MSFWIGEKVLLKKSKRFGIIAGIREDGKVIITVANKTIYTNKSNIQVIDNEEYIYPDWIYGTETSIEPKPTLESGNTIDLHIEKLEPSMLNQSASVILQFQIKKCKQFLDKNVKWKSNIVYIICGKGQGVLKSEIDQIVKTEYSAKFVFEKNNGGMLEVWF